MPRRKRRPPAWEADKRPIYGGFFWLNGDSKFPVPKEAFYMAGAGGQTTPIIPSYDLVVVRLGHYKGAEAGGKSFAKALSLLMQVSRGSEANREFLGSLLELRFPLENITGAGDYYQQVTVCAGWILTARAGESCCCKPRTATVVWFG